MYGAVALVLPIKRGQSLVVSPSPEPGISWNAYENGNLWFKADFQWPPLKLISTSDEEIAMRLLNLLRVALELNPKGLNESEGYAVTTEMNFNREWGFGSSAALVSNIAWWFNTDPFHLYFKIFKGSAFDIASARATGPFLYRIERQKPWMVYMDFYPAFHDHLYFIYLGNKQDSQVSVDKFKMTFIANQDILDQAIHLTNRLRKAESLDEFGRYMNDHETMIGKILNTEPVGRTLFSDFQGYVKSLGAWGGDFIMAAYPGNRQELEEYFHKKGLDTIFSFEELVLH